MNKKLETKIQNNIEFQSIIKDIIEDETVQEMKNYRQHYNTDCFEHCYMASYYCYSLCKKMGLDYKSAARGAMLHDLFLYDWRVGDRDNKWHAFTHGKIACDNATKIFNLNDKEKDIITKHMWPVTPVPPKSIEGFILTLVDKHCVLVETVEHFSKKGIFKYASMLLGVVFLK